MFLFNYKYIIYSIVHLQCLQKMFWDPLTRQIIRIHFTTVCVRERGRRREVKVGEYS